MDSYSLTVLVNTDLLTKRAARPEVIDRMPYLGHRWHSHRRHKVAKQWKVVWRIISESSRLHDANGQFQKRNTFWQTTTGCQWPTYKPLVCWTHCVQWTLSSIHTLMIRFQWLVNDCRVIVGGFWVKTDFNNLGSTLMFEFLLHRSWWKSPSYNELCESDDCDRRLAFKGHVRTVRHAEHPSWAAAHNLWGWS